MFGVSVWGAAVAATRVCGSGGSGAAHNGAPRSHAKRDSRLSRVKKKMRVRRVG